MFFLKKIGPAGKLVPGRARALILQPIFYPGFLSPARRSLKPEWAGPK
jgi:hypothetical protein